MLWSQGGMTTGDVVSLIGIQGLINGYLRDIGEHVRNLQRAVNEMEDVVAFAAQEPEVRRRAGRDAARRDARRDRLRSRDLRLSGRAASRSMRISR